MRRLLSPIRGSARAGRSRPVFLIVTIFSLSVSLGLLWMVWKQSVALESRLSATEERASTLEQNLRQSREEAERFRLEGSRAAQRAEEAAEEARGWNQARRQAELERELAREQAQKSRQESVAAQEKAEKFRAEAERLRKQRQAELDQMREALGRIAETRRTPMGMVINLGEDSFLFDFDKDVLRAENREMLSRIAGVLLASHGYRLQIYGHADDLGPQAYNQQLSERRAQAVGGYLIEAGIPKTLVDVKGFGESAPRLKSSSRQARQKNRRVEIGVIDTIIQYAGEVTEP